MNHLVYYDIHTGFLIIIIIVWKYLYILFIIYVMNDYNVTIGCKIVYLYKNDVPRALINRSLYVRSQ